uniref:Cadherin domain-containing protein n=1 Tax=Tetranychus urticae TaxID=32264 RepID=T1KWG2_TETUR
MLTTRLTRKATENMTRDSCHVNYIQSISLNRHRLKIKQYNCWLPSLLTIYIAFSVQIIPFVVSSLTSPSPSPSPSSSSFSSSSLTSFSPLINKRWSRSTFLSSNSNQLDLKFEITENSPAGTLIGVIRSPSGYQPCQPPFLIVPIRSGTSESSPLSSSSSSLSNLRSGVDTDLSIDQASGEIRNSVVLDREQTSYYTFIAIPFVGPNIKVTITVLDANDNAPLFPVPSIHLEFPENSKVRDVKRTLPPARDRDLGIFGTQKYRIISGNHGNAFRLASHREKDDVLYHDLQVNGVLDRESTSRYSLIVEALDGGLPPLSSQLLVNISILDVNDNEPIFSQSRYVATVLENATLGTPILQVVATDSDEGSNGKIEYSLPTNRRPGSGTSSSESSYFEINKDTGWIYLSRPVDFESKDLHELVVVARDCGLQPLETSAFVSIRVVDVNDNRPTINLLFLTEDAQPIVPENAQIGDFVARISINDPDSASPTGLSSSEFNKFMVTLSGGDDYFSLNRSDVAIYMVTVSKSLDREVKAQYSLTVTVSDSGSPPLNTSMVFDLEISDVNDNPPYFEQSVYHASLPEVADPGTVVYKMKAIDRDSDSQVTYSFSGSNSNSTSNTWFVIDSETGLITTSSQIDCETDSAPQLVVTATDGSSVTATATLIVTISDVNDNEPIFDQSFYNVTTREDTQVGSCILRVSASDPDCGVNSLVNYSSVNAVSLGQSDIPMSITSEKSRSLILTSDFIVDPSTGDLCIARPLDFEKRRSYDIPIMATDRGGLSTTAMVKVTLIDVNDNGPIFYPKEYKVSVEENIVPLSKGRFIEPAPILIVAATDADSSGSPFGTIRYSIRSGNEEKAFEIDPVTGRIYIVRPLSSAKPFYILTIAATDGDDRESIEPALVHVSVLPQGGQSRPYSPVFSQRHYGFEIKENSLIGTKVGLVSATASSSSPLTYAIYSGDPDAYFTIDPTTGTIRVNSETIDAEKYSSLLLNVQAKEGENPGPYRYGHTQVNVTIVNVNDNHPTFGTDRLKIAIPENMSTNNVTVLIAQASDADADDLGNLTYSLQDTQLGSDSTPFIIDKSTGAITLRSSLDFEKLNHYRLIVTATDGGDLSCSMVVDVNIQDVNDCVPRFVGYSDSISALLMESPGFHLVLSEDTPVSAQIYQIRAVDDDTGNNARLTYSIIETVSGKTKEGSKNTESEFPFAIFPNNGILYTRRPLDRESKDNYSFTIQVTDHGSPAPLRSSTSMTITIVDTNDNRPLFKSREWSFSISESAPIGTVIGFVSAIDPDLGENGTLRYSIFKGFSLEASKFALDPQTGEISLKSNLDREAKDRYIFKIDAHDSGKPSPLSAESKTTVIIDVSDVNDNSPTFIIDEMTSGNSNRHIIALGSPEGTYVTTVKASDPDSGINGTLTYSLIDSDSDLFVIGRVNGVIKTARSVEKLASYRVGVQVTDGGGLKSPIKIIQIDVIQRSFIGKGQVQHPEHRSSPSSTKLSSSDSEDNVYHEFRVRETAEIGSEVGTINVALPDVMANFFHRFSYCSNGYYVKYERPSYIDGNEVPKETNSNKFVIESNDFSTIHIIVGQSLDYESSSESSFQIYIDPWQCALTSIPLDKGINYFRPHQNSKNVIGKNYQLISTVKITIIDDISDCHPFETITRDLKESNGTLLDIMIPVSEETIHQRSIDLYPLAEAWSVGCTGLNLNYQLRSLSLNDVTLNRLLVINDKSVLTFKPFDKELINDLVNQGELIIIVQAYLSIPEDIGSSLIHRSPIGSQAIRLLWVKDTGRNMDRVTFNGPATYTFPEDCCHQNENIIRLSLNISHDHFDVNYRFSEISGRESVFSINPENGLVALLEPFDYEKTQEYRLNVTATIYLRTSPGPRTGSNGGRTGSTSTNFEPNRNPIKTISRLFTLKITNINDEKPIFTQPPYNREILESVTPGTLIATIEAKDADSNSDLMYLIPPGHEEYKYFSIDQKTGELKTLISLDRETKEIHRIPVFVFDEDYVHSASTIVTVVLLDVNDNQPIFSSLSQSVKIPENILPGTIFHTIIASDLDSQTGSNSSSSLLPNLDYSIISGNEEGKFGINRATGQLSTFAPLDRERKAGYNLTIQVTDSLHKSQCNLTIDLIDVNDNSPIFDKSVYYAVIDESRLSDCETSGSRVLSVVKVKAIDPDSENSIYYTILASGSPEAMYFTIDPNTGLITTDCAAVAQARKAKLVTLPGVDFAASNPHSLTLSFDVLAIDVGSSPYAAHTTKTTIQVTVMGSHESDSPRLASYPTIIEVSGYKEDYKVGSEIGRISVVNTENSQRNGGVDDSRSGSITVKKSLIYGHHEAFVEIRRSGSPYSTLTLVQVILSGEMLSAKAIGSSESTKRARPSIPYNVSLFENVPLGTEVINLMSRYRSTYRGNGHNEARSPLADYQFQFAFTSVNQSTFYLYPNTGIITIRKLLDFETDPSRIELVIVARKRTSPLSEPIFFTVTIMLINVNDNAPRFTQAHYISTVREGESKGTFVTQISALDVDNVDSAIVSRDSIDIGLSGRSSGKSTVTYHILEGNHDNAFIIDPPGSGFVKTNIVLDREIRDHYVLTIVANDEGPTGLSSASRDSRNLASTTSQLSSHCTLEINVIDINDNVPVFPPYQEISVFEDAEVGATVASLTANDVDTFPPLTYYQKRSHLDGLSDNIDDLFDIGLYTGRITLKSRLDKSLANPTSLPSQPAQYKIAVLASDSLNTIETQVVIKVKPKSIYQRPPVFAKDYYFVPIKLNTHPCVLSGSINCKIAQVSTISSDNNFDGLPRLKVSYKLAGGSSSSKGFYIDSYTGTVYNNRSLSRLSKSPTAGSIFQLTVIAGYANEAGRFISGHKARCSVLVVIPGGTNVNNESLSYLLNSESDSGSKEERTSYTISVRRDFVDQVLLELDGFDFDTFTLTNGNVDRSFALLRGRQLIMNKRPSRSEYKLTIIRRSHQTDDDLTVNNPTTFTVHIKVTSEESGNSSTAFKSQIISTYMSESAPPGHQVTSVRSESEQYGSSYRYSIYSGNELEAFQIDEITGVVTINKSLDFESYSFHQLTIVATSSTDSLSKQNDLCVININVLNENDNKPKFALTSYKIIVDENTPIGTPIVQIMASDADMSSLNYSFTPSMNGLVPFGLDTRTGYIVTTQAIDYETLENYQVIPTFKMVLKAVETSSSSAEVLIEASIGSIDEFPPKFTSERYDFKVTTSYGTPHVVVGHISATDDDLGPDGQIFYTIRSSSPPGAAKKFNLNSTTGLITINTASVDKIPPHFSSLVVSASSGRADSLSSLTRIGVNLILTDDKSTLHSSNNNDILQSGSLYEGSNLSSSPSSTSNTGSQITSLPGWVMFLIIILFFVTCVLLAAIFAIRSHLSDQSSGPGQSHHHHATGHHHQSFMTTSALASIVPGVGTLLRKIGANRNSADGCTHIGNTTIDSMNDTSTTYDHASFQSMHHLVGQHHHHMLPRSTAYLTSGQHESLPPCYNEVNNICSGEPTPGALAGRSGNNINGEGHSASSGRGSAEDDDEVEGDLEEVDEEVRMINEGDGYHTFGLDNPDPPDEHELIPTTAEYLARLVIFDPDIAVREDDLDHLAEEVQSKAGSETKDYLNRPRTGLVTGSLRDRNQMRRPQMVPPIIDANEWNDLSSIEEELSEAYSWNYLSNWSPQYQPLANVYTEIATLKGAIHYDGTIGSSSSGLSDSPAYMRTSSTPAGDDRHETNSHHSHSTVGSRRSAHLAIPSTSSGHHHRFHHTNTRLPPINARAFIPAPQGSAPVSHGSAFMPFPGENGTRLTNDGFACDNRIKGIASDSSSDASTATAVFIDNDSTDRLRL